MDKQIRITLIGFGCMGRNYTAMLAGNLVPELKLAGVCCRNAAGGEQYPNIMVYENMDAMVRHRADFDAVRIVTPHTTHIPIAMEMAKLGKHILLDKPAGIFAGEVRELARFCRDKGLALGMIFNNRSLPAFRKAKEILESGTLGTLHRPEDCRIDQCHLRLRLGGMPGRRSGGGRTVSPGTEAAAEGRKRGKINAFY